MTSPDLSVSIGPLHFKNPIWIGSSEMTMTRDTIRACVESGAGAVVAKSINESVAARRQLDIASYVNVSPEHRPRQGSVARDRDGLLNRSGLAQVSLDEWLAVLAEGQAHARRNACILVGSITVAETEPAADLAMAMSTVVPAVELNVGAPHGREVPGGAVRQLTEAQAVSDVVSRVRAKTDAALFVKLPGQVTDVLALAQGARDAGADAVTLVGRYPGFLPDLETDEPVMGSWGAWSSPGCLPMSLYWVSKLYRATKGGFPIIGTNGARSGDDVLRFLLSGASAVEMVTAVWNQGPAVVRDYLASLDESLRHRGTDVRDVIGHAAERAAAYADLQPTYPPERPWLANFPQAGSASSPG